MSTMNNVSKNEYCYGCGVCAITCPVKAIAINFNNEGFYKPVIDNSVCTNCGLCSKICSYNSPSVLEVRTDGIKSFASWSNDEWARSNCSSGGIAYTISEYFLKKGYNICVVKYDVENEIARHYIPNSVEALKESVGSKYLQSYSVAGLEQINFKQNNLVIGTPCMIDSFRRLLRRKQVEENFILVDFFCHGVPSALAWKKYLKNHKKKLGLIKQVSWRPSNAKWHDSLKMQIKGEHGIYEGGINQGDIFYRLFLQDYCLGRACYSKCKFKMECSSADIRIGDLWGRMYQSNDKGVSALLAVSKKGEEVLSEIPGLYLKEESLSVVVEGQMAKSPMMPNIRALLLTLMKRENSNMTAEQILINIDTYLRKFQKLILHPKEVISNRFNENEKKSWDNNNA